ncbi:hypothetical protein CI610_00249 [invertebrate metagenome]|uniref:Basic amino acid antiporter YfcC n=1 Tax=invertebrate metagenome TaxID=1711999 RepID=A0A2H9TBY8_9ZZZZ
MSNSLSAPSERSSSSTTSKCWKMPDTLIILFCVAACAAVLGYLIPAGSFKTEIIHYLSDGIEKTRTVIIPGSFQYALDSSGQLLHNAIQLFSDSSDIGFLNFVFEGLVSGDKSGSALGIIMFMLVIGGAFGIVMETGTIDNGILKLISKTRGNEILFIPSMFLLFSLGGAVFGMGEESIAFAIIIAPLMVRMGYDGITAAMVTFAATQIGFATSWMNPFSVAIAQGIAGIPVLSGSALRIVMWAVFTLAGTLFTMRYATRIKKNPVLSYSYESDQHFRDHNEQNSPQQIRFHLGDWLVLLTLLGGIIWVIWGVVAQGWFIPEIASQFFTMGLIIGLIGVIFRLNGMTLNHIASSFKEGAASLLPPALVVGMAQGVVWLLGGVDPETPTVMNTLLNSASHVIAHLPAIISAWLMFVFQAVFNFFVTSGSGQAAMTMPLMAPLSDLIGVSRQVAVLAFQLGDGLTNLVVPTSAVLMGALGVCRVEWGAWIRFIGQFMLFMVAIASLFIVGAQIGGYV